MVEEIFLMTLLLD